MKLSTTTGLCQQSWGTAALRDLNEVLQLLREVGYDTIDLSFCFQSKTDYILRGEDWERKIDELGDTAARLGIDFYQSHLPFIPGCSAARAPDFQKPGYAEYFAECTRRAYIASGRLGVKWAVAHPQTYPEYNYEEKATLEANRAWQDKYVELGIQMGVGTAIENMLPSLNRKLSARYCQHYDQLIELVDSFRDPMVGVCWDTGHANQMDLDQGRALRAIGGRLKTLHINDNHDGDRDEHLLPYMGEVDWPVVIQALVEIGYEGSLNYETGKVACGAGGEVQMELARATYQNGLCLLNAYHKALQEKKG